MKQFDNFFIRKVFPVKVKDLDVTKAEQKKPHIHKSKAILTNACLNHLIFKQTAVKGSASDKN